MTSMDEFVTSIGTKQKPDSSLSNCLKSLWWSQKGDWEKAHDIAQNEGSQDGDWIHAYLHRVEGDLGNAAFWYNCASRPVKRNESLEEEWKDLVMHFLSGSA
jgi:hypothetical protein